VLLSCPASFLIDRSDNVKSKFKDTSTSQAKVIFDLLRDMGCDIGMEYPIVVWDSNLGRERTFYADIWFFEVGVNRVGVDIEIDGPQHTSDPDVLQQDADRHRLLSAIRVPVLRFTNAEVDANRVKVANTIYNLLHRRPDTSEKERLFLKKGWEKRCANSYPYSEYVL
jgi:hypothetical protein